MGMAVVMMDVVVVALTLRLLFRLVVLGARLFSKNGSLEGVGWFSGLRELLVITRSYTGGNTCSGFFVVLTGSDLNTGEGLDVDTDAIVMNVLYIYRKT